MRGLRHFFVHPPLGEENNQVSLPGIGMKRTSFGLFYCLKYTLWDLFQKAFYGLFVNLDSLYID